MAESNVVDIRPPKDFEFPDRIGKALEDTQWRIDEALAVARLLSRHIENPPPDTNSGTDFDTSMNAANAIVRLLEPIKGIYDPLELQDRRLAEAED